jgi:2-keto-4-pentenoate hydratase/2-oxohepta-3-ene-1,7-dioic acid hydratase in catechol pathway
LIGEDGKIRDLSGHVSDLSGKTLSPSSLKKLGKLKDLPAVKGNPRLGACVAGTGKFICIGLNYSDHAAETGATVPPEPIIFMKATSAIVRTERPDPDPARFEEDRLGGRTRPSSSARRRNMSRRPRLSPCRGLRRASNDVSERAFQTERSGQWTKGKSCDNFGQTGPVARHQATRWDPSQPRNVADGQRQDAAGRLDRGPWSTSVAFWSHT